MCVVGALVITGIAGAGFGMYKLRNHRPDPELIKAVNVLTDVRYTAAQNLSNEAANSARPSAQRIELLKEAEGLYKPLRPECPKSNSVIAQRCRNDLTLKIENAEYVRDSIDYRAKKMNR